MSDTRSSDWEKKSERVEVRLSHAKKHAFKEACNQQGDLPSEALRRSIESYLNRSNIDLLSHIRRATTQVFRQNWKPTLVAFLIAFSLAFFISAS